MILLKSSFKYFSKHYIQSLLAVLGIVLGVCMLIAIDLCIESSKKAFETSLTQSFGKATHYIYSDANGFKDEIYKKLKVDLGIEYASPFLESDLIVKSKNSEPLKLKFLGLDPFSYRDFSISQEEIISSDDNDLFKKFFLCDDCVIVSKNTAAALKLKEGEILKAEIESSYKDLKLVKIIDSSDFDNLILADIGTAQRILNKEGSLTRIDLISPSEAAISGIKTVLDPGTEILSTLKTKKSTQKMLKSFNLNLYSLSFLCLIVSIFLIFNTISFSVTQRQTIFGIFSTIGLDKRSIFNLVLMETILIAIVGSLLGIFLGIGLAQFLITYISQTINDLYFVLNVSELYIAPLTIFKGFAAGIFAALLGALIPAFQASRIQAVRVTKRSTQELETKSFIKILPLVSLVFLVLASLIINFSGDNIVLNFLALGLIILAAALLTPIFIRFLIMFFNLKIFSFLGPKNKMAINSIENNLSRTSIAITALMIALSISMSLDITVSSFRETVRDWLDATLRADVYISAPSLRANRTTGTLSDELIKDIRNLESVKEYSKAIITYRNNEANSNMGSIRIASIGLNEDVIDSFRFKKVLKNWQEDFESTDSVIISEPLAYKKKLKPGSEINIRTNNGYKKFKVLGVFFDYGTDQGIAMIYKDRYQRLWNDYGLSSLGVILRDDSNKISEIKEIKAGLAKLSLDSNFNYRSNFEIKEESIKIFNRTFKITEALKVVTILIAFIAIISVLLSLNLERYKEFAILEALGMNKKEIGYLITVQSFSMGLIAALFSIPLGILEAYLLISVINLRSFGWTLNFELDPMIILEIFIIAVLAALLASIYPSFKHIRTALALRND